MCSTEIMEQFVEMFAPDDFYGKSVLEIGSKDVNGSVRPIVMKFGRPTSYTGVDIEPGRFVDMTVSAEDILHTFGTEAFDVLISTETMEHVRNWRLVIDNIKHVLKPSGVLYLSTVSPGYHYHGAPHDYWRYEVADLEAIFQDFEILYSSKSTNSYSVYIKARKPANWKPADLSAISLYSMLTGKRSRDVPERMPLGRRTKIKLLWTASTLQAKVYGLLAPK